ncbi:M20/M25/M40 family metallo-hydrolase [Tengunoibacter tsumagoiensis]|uniref:Peptidase M20 dimerisation domain-containing protein n=1 Tax=Tengunoibacter tsumagoiensis TaxID=2014871 RepID=A0A401ZYK3_9CHLR|nr:M20/M25/M40 family metallo-hydrolase [Tengunoibacter tsumagoiensis]GCE11902.1 hypothetical protein KTT_17610 [Tengunoibacter tsumagoiensis]
MFIYSDRLCQTLIDLVRIPSTSGHEEYVRSYIERHLTSLGLTSRVDVSGNLIATLDGEGPALLLNAHMDRVSPGLGHEPILRNGVLYSDGTTNLGADDAAGIAIILEVLRRTVEQSLPHPPLVVVFTVQEEVGLCGARSFDAEMLQVTDGIVFDNAFEAGVVVSKAAAHEAFDIKITGRTGHPGKEITGTVDALEIFRQTPYPHGSLASDLTRINIGRIVAGHARNAIPGTVTIEGELRSFEPLSVYQHYKQALINAFDETAERLGGRAEITFTTYSTGYALNPDEPLLNIYQAALAQRGAVLEMKPTFIGSDTSGFRPAIRTFTVSTGVVDEHTTDEHIALAPLEQLVMDTLFVLHLWRNQQF